MRDKRWYEKFGKAISVGLLSLSGLGATSVGVSAEVAGERAEPQSRPVNSFLAQTLRVREVSDERGLQYRLTERTNHNGEYEVQVDLKERRVLAPDTWRILVIGRGIDVPEALAQGNGGLKPRRATTWFIVNGFEVLPPIEYVQTGDDPWPTVRSFVAAHLDSGNRWYAWVMATEVASQISIAYSQWVDFFSQIQREQLELYDLEVRVNHLQANDPRDPFVEAARLMIAEGWISIHSRIGNEKTRKIWLYGAGDVAITITGMKLFSLLGKAAHFGVQKAADSRISRAVAFEYARFVSRAGEKAALTGRLAKRAQRGLAEAAVRARFLGLPLQERIGTAISFMESRSVLARGALRAVKAVAQVLGNGLKEYKYVGMAMGTQVMMEALARSENLFSSNLAIVASGASEIADGVSMMIQDPEFQQNFSYMSLETFLMMGTASSIPKSFGKSVVICGAIGGTNSLIMNLGLLDKTGSYRVFLDTAWEGLVGSLQTTIDRRALDYFEGLAVRRRNPKVKLLGYAVALVDQSIGYYVYAKATHAVTLREARSKLENMAKEVGSSEANETGLQENAPSGEINMQIPDMKIQLVPVFAAAAAS